MQKLKEMTIISSVKGAVLSCSSITLLEGIWKNWMRKSNYLEYIYYVAQYTETLPV
jgi:hypothetical protein